MTTFHNNPTVIVAVFAASIFVSSPSQSEEAITMQNGTRIIIRDGARITNNGGDGIRNNDPNAHFEIGRADISGNKGMGFNNLPTPEGKSRQESKVQTETKPSSSQNPTDDWYKKPVGIIFMSTAASVIAAFIIYITSHFWLNLALQAGRAFRGW